MRLEKRKDIRIRHRDSVDLATASGSIQGLSVNLSRGGIQVVVNMAESYDSIRSITFTIPRSGERVQLPCRLVRSFTWNGSKDRVLGIEFLAGAENQLTLIEKCIQELQQNRIDSRQIPRTACYIDAVSADSPDVQILSIDNLSTEGLLVSYVGKLHVGDTLYLNVSVPGDPRPLRLQARVVYVLQNAFRDALTAGLRLLPLREIEERRLHNLIVACSSGGIFRSLHHHLESLPLAQEYRIGDPRRIARMFSNLQASCTPISLLIEGSFTVREYAIVEVDKDRQEFSIGLASGDPVRGYDAGRAAYFAFSWKANSFYFKTEIVVADPDRISFTLPKVLFKSDSRSYQRKALQKDNALRLSITAEGEPMRSFHGTVLNISRRGFLCELLVPADLQALFQQGMSVRYSADERLGLDSHGQIRHLRAYPFAEGVLLRLGIEAGIARDNLPIRRISSEEWQQGRPYQGEAEGPDRRIESLKIRVRNPEGKEISALINATALPAEGPVVIIPPAYGKKKEAYAPLVATLLATFWAEAKPLILIRYDGINRPGESHQDRPNLKRGYEMLSYRWNQGLEDLRTILDFAKNNPYFTARGVILISFSMAAIESRRLASLQQEGGVDLWISCMGATCAQSCLRNTLGGIDVISNHRTGIPNGTMGLLGHLLDMDRTAQDLIENKYAYMTDARLDMSRIGIPVFWIYGRFDRWVDMDEVIDLMSVRSAGRREVLEIPTGHNLRTSEDAIQTFKLMAGFLYEQLHGRRITPRDPNKEQMVRLLIDERERLEARSAPPLPEYWRDYLIGNERGSAGYDFYRNIEEIMGFLREEAESLTVNDRELIADMGCGTGLFLEVLLDTLARRGRPLSGCEITAVDLVQEALDKTREKCQRMIEAHPALSGIRFKYIQANLEPNRLIPVAEFMRSRHPSFDFLRGAIDGLSNAILDRLARLASGELYAFMRGEELPAHQASQLLAKLSDGNLDAVLDFNRAARFLKNRIQAADLKPDAGSWKISQNALRTSDLQFKILDFGDYGPNLNLDFPDAAYSIIVASLFISYLFNPRAALAEFHRMLKPGGTLLVSSMKPDSDISLIFTNFVGKLQEQEGAEGVVKSRKSGLGGALAMLNEAAGLFELEEDGFFRFYTDEELRELLLGAGFSKVTIRAGMGDPPQAYMAIAQKEPV